MEDKDDEKITAALTRKLEDWVTTKFKFFIGNQILNFFISFAILQLFLEILERCVYVFSVLVSIRLAYSDFFKCIKINYLKILKVLRI